MSDCSPHALYIVKDQLLPHVSKIDVEVVDYNGQLIQGAFTMNLIIEVTESAYCINSGLWPGPEQRMADPRLNRNMLIIEQ